MGEHAPRVVALSELAAPGGLVGGPFGSSLGRRDYVAIGVPVIRGQNLSAIGRFHAEDFVYVTKEKVARELARNTAQPGDVVFTQRGTLGQVGLVPNAPYETYVISQSQMRLRVNRQVADAQYVYYCFLDPAMQELIRTRAVTTGVPHINLGTLAELPVPYRTLPEQRAIAEVLGALDDKIEANRRIADRAEHLAIAVATTAESTAKVGDVAAVCRQLVSTSFFAGQIVEHFSLPAFDAGRLPLIEEGDAIKSGKLLLTRPTILVSKLNPHIPRIWMATPAGSHPAITSTEFVGLLPAANYPVELLWSTCASGAFSSQLVEMVKGTTGSHQRVSSEDVLSLEVPDPRAIPQAATETITTTVGLAQALRRESVHLTALRDALLPKLLSGELRVRGAEDHAEDAV